MPLFSTDYDGVARPQGSSWDIGAFEFAGGGTPDTTDPTVTLTEPSDATTITGNVNVVATAADDVAVGGVQFLLDGANLGSEVLSSPYVVVWNSAASSNGAHTLQARARDIAGNTALSSVITVTADNAVVSVDPVTPVTDPPAPPTNTVTLLEPIAFGVFFYNILGEVSPIAIEAETPHIIEEGTDAVARPPVPVIDETIGFSEFIQVVIANAGNGTEGVLAYYGYPPSSSALGGLTVQNKSSDPSVRITRVDYNCAASDAGGFAPGGSLLGSDWDTGNSLPIANFAIGPPFAYSVSYLGGGGGELLYTTNESAAAIYNEEIEIYETARLSLSGFSEDELGVSQPSVTVGVHARGAVVYIDALSRTVFEPVLPAHQGSGGGYFGWFANLYNQPITATISVRFSTGRVIEQVVEAMGAVAGYEVLPTVIGESDTQWELEDYFLFISESTFSNDLDSPTGRWEDVLDNLPSGIFVTALARFHEIISTTIDGIKLDPDTTYYYRVGSRRPVSLATEEGTYIYSETLSEEATGQLSVQFAAPAPVEEEPTPTVGSIKQLMVWMQAGTNRIEQEASAPFRVPADCVLERWYMEDRDPGSGTGTLTVNVRRNGTDLFSGGNIPSLAVGEYGATGTAFSNTTLEEGDMLRWDVRTIPTGPGSRVTFGLIVRQDVVEV